MAEKAVGFTPEADSNEDHGQGDELSDFHTHIEGEEVRNQAVRRDVVFDDLGGQAETMEEPENQRGGLGVGLEAKPTLIGTDVVQCLVDDGQTDNRINDVTIDAHVEVNPQQHRGGMPQGKQAHVDRDVLHLVEEENDTQQEQQVVISGDHVFGPQIDERNKVYPGNFLDVPLVALGDGMSEYIGTQTQQAQS